MVIAPGPRSLRRVDTCTWMLASSTTSPGHAKSSSSPLVSSRPGFSTSASRRSKARAPSCTGSPSRSRTRSTGRSSKRPNRSRRGSSVSGWAAATLLNALDHLKDTSVAANEQLRHRLDEGAIDERFRSAQDAADQCIGPAGPAVVARRRADGPRGGVALDPLPSIPAEGAVGTTLPPNTWAGPVSGRRRGSITRRSTGTGCRSGSNARSRDGGS